MKYINLYHEKFRPARVVLPTARLAWGPVLFAAVLGAHYGQVRWDAEGRRSDNDHLEARVADLEKRAEAAARLASAASTDPHLAGQIQALEKRIQALARVQGVVASGALGTAYGYSRHFRALARSRVPGAWLTGVALEGKGNTLSLTGRALSSENAAHYVNRLRVEPQFAGFSFAAMELRAADAGGQPGTAANASAQARPGMAAPQGLEFHLLSRLADAKDAAAVPGAQP